MANPFPWLPWPAIAAFTVAAIAWCWQIDWRRPSKPTAPKPWPGSKETRLTAVYGAYLAAQVAECLRKGRTPDRETMAVFVEEARAVAELAGEAE